MFAFRGSKNLVHNRFTEEDDQKLKQLVNEYGENNWDIIAKKMKGRNKRQCRDRWNRYLAPNVNHSEWTVEEEKLLMSLVPILSPRWREIAKHFSGRNDIQIKNRYKMIQNRLLHENQKENVKQQIKTPVTQPNTLVYGQPIQLQEAHISLDDEFNSDFAFNEEADDFSIFCSFE
ncbi:Myb-like DNA-binding domain containing protein [Trichomonas vaginalis G3]|uniref:Myb-like DNA-binding domain containing protein n=1 Tax=Trichomonas vaginalis (strain ATCC PRA-98 / G3) TaxID=412133 RepID=A2F2H4_TRIV3|nr:RNA polymerase II transcription regulator recruiting protein [Trichomonas vaginalis G3]EAY00874.1 Myb-like DNA-binding domain containing protein [Trichomonas vaginalis G3]KAI5489253.1 RNA polymerase II transcription regulator recruiting protein [Trichomonas vaginalis G3]|eukprot:XP_001313803.1 Myb-like DNA-binding domain containing protein [Trichomonas vaginalis G3]